MLRGFLNRYKVFLLLAAGIVAIFVTRTLLARYFDVPRLFDIFDTLTIAGSLYIWLKGYRHLKKSDWIIASIVGVAVGAGMCVVTLFMPYPYWRIVYSIEGQALLRGSFTLLASLGGLVILRQGGPVQFYAADGKWRRAFGGMLIGLAIGLPLAVLNVFALQMTQREAITWQNPMAALLDALQPGIVEEAIYRFALLGLFWLILRNSLPERASWLAGLLAMVVHNFAHFDDLFLQAPLTALGMGILMALIWGLPPTVLALRRDIGSAAAFHWIQDVARFLAGF